MILPLDRDLAGAYLPAMSAASEMLEIPEVRARISALSVAEYHHLSELNENGRRTELIRGVVIEKMSKSPLHSGIASLLYDLLQPQLPSQFWLRKEEPLTLRDSEPEPDISLVRGLRRDYARHHPSTAILVVEIAVSSAAADRAMAGLYAEAGVEEYWIVLALERRVEIYRRPEAGTYSEKQMAENEAIIRCACLDGVAISLRELFGEV